MSKKISIIGAGALGGSVAQGFAKAGLSVLAADLHSDRLTHLRQSGVSLTSDNREAASVGDVVMFAVKPHLTVGVIEEAAPLLEGRLCVSLAAAVTLDMLQRAAPKARWARAMTNICAAMNCAFTGFSPSSTATPGDAAFLKEAFGLLGQVEEVAEGSLDALTALTGAAPAFFLTLMEAAAMGGIQAGLPKDVAYKGATAAMLGAARLAIEGEGRPPSTIRDAICTPGGMTIEGIAEIENRGARGAVMRAVVLTAEKGKTLTAKLLP
ncbi:MAG: NAD(P)-binding domain-containing protein [Synergistaceae bacterium]|jgi:pyrroline-5-carboxylate reductase|nr:NAD(P)-binding domain-containing protein [Synergistaceae bacterium]